jgi:hypothetical protein
MSELVLTEKEKALIIFNREIAEQENNVKKQKCELLRITAAYLEYLTDINDNRFDSFIKFSVLNKLEINDYSHDTYEEVCKILSNINDMFDLPF